MKNRDWLSWVALSVIFFFAVRFTFGTSLSGFVFVGIILILIAQWYLNRFSSLVVKSRFGIFFNCLFFALSAGLTAAITSLPIFANLVPPIKELDSVQALVLAALEVILFIALCTAIGKAMVRMFGAARAVDWVIDARVLYVILLVITAAATALMAVFTLCLGMHLDSAGLADALGFFAFFNCFAVVVWQGEKFKSVLTVRREAAPTSDQ